MRKYYCIDCEEEISDYRGKRCGSCNKKYYFKTHKAWNYNPERPKCIICGNELSSRKNKTRKCYNCRKVKKNFCIDCGDEISSNAKRCRKHANIKSIKQIIKNRKSYKGKNNPMFGKKRKHSLLTRKKMSKKHKGKLNPFYGKTLKPYWVKYKSIWFRSNWEVLFAQFLDLSRIKWLYEPKVFDLENTTYTPDFYIPKWDMYIEIKGFWRGKGKEKYNKFKRLYSNINIKLFNYKKLYALGIVSKR